MSQLLNPWAFALDAPGERFYPVGSLRPDPFVKCPGYVDSKTLDNYVFF